MFDGLTNWLEFVGDNRDEILEATLDHAQIALTVVLLATVFSVVLAVLVERRPTLRAASLSRRRHLPDHPLARPVRHLHPDRRHRRPRADHRPDLYSILPILRNTVTGLEEVDRAVVESAKGMGLARFQRLVRVELPLAWPVILTGIRVATLLNVGIAAIAVLVGGSGLGAYINDGLTRYRQPRVSRTHVGRRPVHRSLLALVFDLLFGIIRKLTTPKGLR